MRYDVVIVGSGFTGSVIARELADRTDAHILLLEKRSHIGGNMYDKTFENGVLVHMYGPHTFFTDEKWIIDYIQKFSKWVPLDVTAQVEIDDRLFSLPFGFQFIREYYGKEKADLLIARLKETFPNQERVAIYDLLNQEDEDIRHFANMLCEKDYYPYTSKQWGIPMEDMDPSVISRVKFALSDDNRYIQQKYQYTPVEGYTDFFRQLLASDHIKVVTEVDALDLLSFNDALGCCEIKWEGQVYRCPIVYTGPIDELFSCRFGSLPYRSLDIEFKSFDRTDYQSVPFISYPQADGYTRIVEYKKLTGQAVEGNTTISVEYPRTYVKGENLPYYPVINKANLEKFEKYRELTENYGNLFVCGRLGDYKYYNMDAAIVRAMEIGRQIEDMITG